MPPRPPRGHRPPRRGHRPPPPRRGYRRPPRRGTGCCVYLIAALALVAAVVVALIL